MRKQIAFALLLSFSALAFSAQTAIDARCAGALLKKVKAAIYDPNAGLLRDAEKDTAFPYWGRLSQAMHATNEKELRALLVGDERLTLEDIDRFWWSVRIGDVKVDSDVDRFVMAFRDFAVEHPDVFNGSEDAPFRLLEAIKAEDLKHGYSGEARVATETTDRGIQVTEETLLAQAIQESHGRRNQSNRWYDILLNFFSPHYHRMQDIVGFNQNMRRSMQQMFIADEPVEDTLTKYSKRFDPTELAVVEGLITDTPTQLQGERGKIVSAYGRELTVTNPVKIGDLRLRDVHRRVGDIDEEKDFAQAVTRSETDMDFLDKTIASARARENSGPRPMSEYHLRQLQIRYPQYTREGHALQGQQHDLERQYPKHPGYTVTATWTVTVTHEVPKTRQVQKTRTNSDGSTETYTETENYIDTEYSYYTRTENFTLQASYREVLDNQVTPSESEVASMLPAAQTRGMYAVSASNGSPTITGVDQRRISWILQTAARARDHETPLRSHINKAVSEVDAMGSAYPGNIKTDDQWKAALARFDTLRAELLDLYKSQLEEYQNLDAAQVVGQWENDRPEHFASRNQLLARRFLHLVRRIDHLQEEFRRKVSNLEIVYTLPDYPDQFADLRGVHRRNRTIQAIGGSLIGIASAIGGYLSYEHYQQPPADPPALVAPDTSLHENEPGSVPIGGGGAVFHDEDYPR